MPTDPRQKLGISGENIACDELRRRGYAILARRYRTRIGELDIVARQGATLVFVEVKMRRGLDFGSGAEAVTSRKRAKIRHMAEDFVARTRLSRVPCRFDVVSILAPPGGDPNVEVLESAFTTSD